MVTPKWPVILKHLLHFYLSSFFFFLWWDKGKRCNAFEITIFYATHEELVFWFEIFVILFLVVGNIFLLSSFFLDIKRNYKEIRSFLVFFV